MLFNSAVFIAGFLPVVLLGFFLFAGTGRQRLAGLWLTLASLVFYGWWDPHYVPLLLASMTANYCLGGYLLKHPSRAVLVLGIAGNLLLLGYYKYTGFLLSSVDQAFGLEWTVPNIILPLAISFFTFQQIAYLSDAHDGAVVEHDFLNYCLFITFFPHLIAGPITHHREMLSQFSNPDNFRPRFDNISVGATLFLLGLFKKVVFADPMGAEAAPSSPPRPMACSSGCSTPGAARSPTRCRSTSTSRATPTWRSASACCSASACRRISTAPTRRATSSNTGRAGT
ncbi:MBOAT family O-acyltransferase [Teichococcus aestuarii]|uniref:MBOAT family O-acyltransferase n=1 Tax=Teichococcus aestuarii TaxID=568898 RepID=UPI0036128908